MIVAPMTRIQLEQISRPVLNGKKDNRGSLSSMRFPVYSLCESECASHSRVCGPRELKGSVIPRRSLIGLTLQWSLRPRFVLEEVRCQAPL